MLAVLNSTSGNPIAEGQTFSGTVIADAQSN